MSSIQSTAQLIEMDSLCFNCVQYSANGVFCWHHSSYSEHCDWILSREKVRKRKFTEFRHFSFADGILTYYFGHLSLLSFLDHLIRFHCYLRIEKSQLIFSSISITILFIISTILFTGKKNYFFFNMPVSFETESSTIFFFSFHCLHIFIRVLWFFIYFCFLQTA